MLWHDLDIKLKEWFDENGVFIKGHQSWGQTREVYFTEFSNRELNAHSQGPVHGEGVAPDEIILKYTGPSGMVIVPGHGPAMGTTGLLVIRLKLIDGEWFFVEVIKSTNHFTYDEEDLQAFCSYLAGELAR